MSGNMNDAGVEGLRISERSVEGRDRTATNGDNENLCTRCENLDIKRILEDYPEAEASRSGGYIVKCLGSLESMKQSKCPLCKFFSKMVPEHPTNSACGCYGVKGQHTFPSFETQDMLLVAMTVGYAYLDQWRPRRGRPDVSGMQKQVMLGLAPMNSSGNCRERSFWKDFWISAHHCWYRIGMIAALTSSGNNVGWNLQTREISPKGIPYDIVTTWLDTCRNDHFKCADISSSKVPCAKVIDCRTGEIVTPPPKCQYLALSYVWGPTQENLPGPKLRAKENSIVLAMPDSVPLTVSDAMEVVRQLGYRYLWVDKYCIDQENTIEKDTQIKCMDQIYACCTLVIVAAAGKDSSFGLAGVSTASRKSQPTVTTKGITLCSTLPNPVYAISRSTWMTRGWTYQEGIFSPRHLYFTEHQVFFECMHSDGTGTFWSEVFGHPPTVQVLQYRYESHVMRSPGLEITDRNDEPFLLRMRITQHISGFSSRDLTRDGDALNACQGILQRLQRLEPSIPHFYGLPIQDATVSADKSLDGSGSNGVVRVDYKPRYLGASGVLASALYWYHKPVSAMHCKRRSQFPTWTWLGWTKEVCWSKGLPFDETNDIEIEVEGKKGKLWPWDTWERARVIIGIQDSMTGRLRIRGWLIQVKIQNRKHDHGHKFFVSREEYTCAVELHVSASAPAEPCAPTLPRGDNSMDSGHGSDSSNFYEQLLDESKTWEFLSLGSFEPLMLLKDEGSGQFSRWGMTERPKPNRSKSASGCCTYQRRAELWLI